MKTFLFFRLIPFFRSSLLPHDGVHEGLELGQVGVLHAAADGDEGGDDFALLHLADHLSHAPPGRGGPGAVLDEGHAAALEVLGSASPRR